MVGLSAPTAGMSALMKTRPGIPIPPFFLTTPDRPCRGGVCGTARTKTKRWFTLAPSLPVLLGRVIIDRSEQCSPDPLGSCRVESSRRPEKP